MPTCYHCQHRRALDGDLLCERCQEKAYDKLSLGRRPSPVDKEDSPARPVPPEIEEELKRRAREQRFREFAADVRRVATDARFALAGPNRGPRAHLLPDPETGLHRSASEIEEILEDPRLSTEGRQALEELLRDLERAVGLVRTASDESDTTEVPEGLCALAEKHEKWWRWRVPIGDRGGER